MNYKPVLRGWIFFVVHYHSLGSEAQPNQLEEVLACLRHAQQFPRVISIFSSGAIYDVASNYYSISIHEEDYAVKSNLKGGDFGWKEPESRRNLPETPASGVRVGCREGLDSPLS